MARSLLPIDIAHTLESLEHLSANPKAPEAQSAFRTHVAALSSWGEILGIEGFVTLSRTTLTLLRLSPDCASTVLKLALEGYHAVYELALQGQTALTPLALQPQPAVPLAPVSPAPSSGDGRLKTSSLFIWKMNSLMFALPSDGVAEILIPESGQIIQTERQQQLRWRNRTIPIYVLVQRNQKQQSPPEVTLVAQQQLGPETATKTTLLVVGHQGQYLALDVEIERLVTEAELEFKPPKDGMSLPNYFYGYVRQTQGRPIALVNVAVLIGQRLNPEQSVATAPVHARQPQNVADRSHPGNRSEKPTIMVVDDSTTLRKILTLKLNEVGYQVVQAQDGQEALNLLQRNFAIQLVVCDIDMPNMNGFEFLSHCRRDPHFATLPVVMLSTYNETHHRHLAKTLGANAYFGKPYQEQEFLQRLRSMVGTP